MALLFVECVVTIALTLDALREQGWQVANGYPTWQAAEGIMKAWSGDKAITYKQKSLIEWTGLNSE